MFKNHKINTFLLLTFLVGGIFVILCIWILALRAGSIAKDSFYVKCLGGEAPALYGIYKVWIGDSVYQPLGSHSSTVMLFNYLFYYMYGMVAKLIIHNAEYLPVFTRFFTLVGNLVFLTVMFFYLWHESRGLVKNINEKIMRSIVLLLPIIACIGPFIGWWYMTARPDMIAVGIEIMALICFLYSNKRHKDKFIILVTLLFWLAWSMKQTAIFIWIGILFVLCIQRQWRQAAISATVFFILSLVPLCFFGHPYIEHAILMPFLNVWHWVQAFDAGKEAFLIGGYIYVPAFIFMVYYLLDRKKKENPSLYVLAIVLAVSLIGNIMISMRTGGARNYYFSSFLIALLFFANYLIWGWYTKDEKKKLLLIKFTALSFCFGLFLSSLYLVLPNKIGKIELLTDERREKTKRLIKHISLSSKPVFVESPYYALPWYSGQYPSDVIDWTILYKGLPHYIYLEKRINDRYYTEAFIFSEELTQLFQRAGYKKHSRIGDLIHFYRE